MGCDCRLPYSPSVAPVFSQKFDTVNLCVLIYVTGLRICQTVNLIHILLREALEE
jgi:hypothetical protein